MCAVIDDGSEDIEARIARCAAETGLSDRDLVVIIKRFFERAPGEAQEPPWTMRPPPRAQSRQRAPMAHRKDLPMFSRIRDRIAKLEEQILPKPAARVFFIVIEDQSPLTSDEQLAAFKAEKDVAATDHLVVFTFA
jgi:hypothetical protein